MLHFVSTVNISIDNLNMIHQDERIHFQYQPDLFTFAYLFVCTVNIQAQSFDVNADVIICHILTFVRAYFTSPL